MMIDLVDLYKAESSAVFSSIPSEEIAKFVQRIISAYNAESKIFVCANGGGASGAENFVVDMNMHPFVSEDKTSKSNSLRNKFHCINLCAGPGTLTGVMNDLGPAYIYSEQLRYSAMSNDLLIAFSGSGNSPNIVEALKYAKEAGMHTTLISRNPNPSSLSFIDHLIPVPGKSTFPGQTGKNNNNFHFEDVCIKLTHIAVGLLKAHVSDNQ